MTRNQKQQCVSSPALTLSDSEPDPGLAPSLGVQIINPSQARQAHAHEKWKGKTSEEILGWTCYFLRLAVFSPPLRIAEERLALKGV